LLQGSFDRFTEGFETPDLKDAKELLDQLLGLRDPSSGIYADIPAKITHGQPPGD